MGVTEIHPDQQIFPGSSNQILGVNNAGTADEYKSLSGTTHQIIKTDGVGTITLSTPQNIDTNSSPTFASETLSNTTNQIVLGTTHTTTISSTAPSASRTYTIPDAGGAANVVLDQGNYTIGGTWTFNNSVTLASSKALVLTDNSTDTVSIKATNSTTTYTFSLPTTAGTNKYFLQTDGSGNTSWQQGGGVGFREDYVVGTALNNYTGSSTVFNLVNSYNVGGHTLVVTLDGDVQTIGSTVDYLETNSTTVTFNNALVTGQKVSFIFSQPPTSTSGIVNSGTATHLSYYAASGTTLSDASGNTINGSYTFSGGAGAITLSSSTIAMGSNKITGLANGTVSSDAAAFGQLTVIQAGIQTDTTSATATSTNTFTTTSCSASITPTSSSNRVRITASGVLTVTAGGNVQAYATIARGTTDLSSSGFGFQTVANPGTGILRVPCMMTWIDSPATTSSTTYNVRIKNSDNATAISFGGGNPDQVMILEEIV